MASTVFHLLVFTALPLAVLLIGIGLSIGYAYLLGDRRILLATVLFALMASHQTTEVIEWFAGGNPHQNVLGEIFETAVNLLAVVSIGYVVWSLREERRVRESLSAFQGALLANRPRRPGGRTDESPGRSFAGLAGVFERSRTLTGIATAISNALPFGQRSRLDEVLERAVENARITFPIATVELDAVAPVEVVADDHYLQEVLEVVLEQLVLYNDQSDPVIRVGVEEAHAEVAVEFAHNGSGLPESVRSVLESGPSETGSDVAELVFVQTFVTKWGGRVTVGGDPADTAVTLHLAKPRFVGPLA